MNKIDFAYISSFVASMLCRPLSFDELRGLEAALNVNGAFKSDPAMINDLLRRVSFGDSKIEAIKCYRQITGCSLIDSKNAVEALLATRV